MKKNKSLRILVSVSNREGLVEFLNDLNKTFPLEIVATFGTAEYLKKNNIEATTVGEITGFPSLFGGRIKMIHLPVFAAILADQKNPDHLQQLKQLKVKAFNMVVVNLYPFKEKVFRKSSHKLIVENIDIGGPAAIRAAAKNFQSIIAICDPKDYSFIGKELNKNGKLSLSYRKKLAAKVFVLTSQHDKEINKYLAS
jgi:phosphoribosylaminoimidazolecarboxamide formyltransferase / IMP cyclohydrolase